MAKKTSAWVRQETISSSKIGKEVQKPYCGKGPGWLSFLDYAQSIFFFQLPNRLWDRSDPGMPGDKKAKNRSSMALYALSHSMEQRQQSVTYIYREITSWLVRLYDFYSLVVKNRKLTRSLRSLVRLRFFTTLFVYLFVYFYILHNVILFIL